MSPIVKNYSLTSDQAGKACRGQTLQLAANFLKIFYSIGTRGQCYKTFYVRNLRIFVISQSVCPWQAFPAQSNVCLVKQTPTLFKNLSYAPLQDNLLAFPTNNRLVWRAAKDKHSSLLGNFVNYGCKKFYSIGTRRDDRKTLESKNAREQHNLQGPMLLNFLRS